ncbi:DMT family transporter [Pseudotabrizicola algicola]|uniref:DMT family transporter n=1 Tax=Pseudotabrizicola algicola TaxID=2709381 RepID=A0A6B3RW32_9RHOB|nr:DMT family transporter [Pseudotabrizicola algicola]NEX47219.1 DMT family transporter [Pseudotabrizicola algicola]
MTPPRRDSDYAGAPWLIADMMLITCMTVIVKLQGATYPAAQLVFLRALLGGALIVPLVWRHRRDFAAMRHPWRNAARVACNAGALTCNFLALAHLPLALVTAISFTRQPVTMVLAVTFLRERVRPLAWAGTALAFCGVMVMIGPVALAPGLGLLAALGSVLFGSLATIQTRALRAESAVVMMVFYVVGLLVLTAGPAWLFWVPVQQQDWPALFAIGLLAQIGQFCFLRAYRFSPASVLAPLSYGALVLATGAGWLVFGDVPTLATGAGIAIILLALRIVHLARGQSGAKD